MSATAESPRCGPTVQAILTPDPVVDVASPLTREGRWSVHDLWRVSECADCSACDPVGMRRLESSGSAILHAPVLPTAQVLPWGATVTLPVRVVPDGVRGDPDTRVALRSQQPWRCQRPSGREWDRGAHQRPPHKPELMVAGEPESSFDDM